MDIFTDFRDFQRFSDISKKVFREFQGKLREFYGINWDLLGFSFRILGNFMGF